MIDREALRAEIRADGRRAMLQATGIALLAIVSGFAIGMAIFPFLPTPAAPPVQVVYVVLPPGYTPAPAP